MHLAPHNMHKTNGKKNKISAFGKMYLCAWKSYVQLGGMLNKLHAYTLEKEEATKNK
jgi:hypothetical protein